MKSFNNEQKNDLLKDYFVNKKTFLTVIIISSSLILLTAILIVILLNTSTNRLYDNEKILPGYIQINSISATYNIDDISKAVLLYNNKYSYLIHTIRVDGEKIDEVKNEYIFSDKGEHTVKFSLKKPLKTTEEFFINCDRLTEVNLQNLTTMNIKTSASMFYNCSNLQKVNFSNYDDESLTNISHMFYNCNSLTSVDLSRFISGYIIDISSLFYNCHNLSSIFLDIFLQDLLLI